MKNILWIYTGGTIACEENYGESTEQRGLSPKKKPVLSDFLKDERTLIPDGISVTPYVLFNLDSTNIGAAHWRKIARMVFNFRKEYDGFVITHGTDTMQYTSAALSLMLFNFDKPVILTGSQKPFKSGESDAPFNFASAFACAALIDRGVYVCFGGRIIGGESAFKSDSLKDDAFTGAHGDFGRVYFSRACGEINNDKKNKTASIGNYTVSLFKNPPVLNGETELRDNLCEDVFYLKIMPNTKTDITEFIKSRGYKGVVAEAYGLGGIQEELLNALSELCKDGVRVIVVSQCVFGGADLDVYNVGIKARSAGMESGGGMTGGFALIKLMHELAEN